VHDRGDEERGSGERQEDDIRRTVSDLLNDKCRYRNTHE
jgi:hypothetical protein